MTGGRTDRTEIVMITGRTSTIGTMTTGMTIINGTIITDRTIVTGIIIITGMIIINAITITGTTIVARIAIVGITLTIGTCFFSGFCRLCRHRRPFYGLLSGGISRGTAGFPITGREAYNAAHPVSSNGQGGAFVPSGFGRQQNMI